MRDTRIAVIIPNWNGITMIAACLRSLEAQTIKHTAIVVDNGSTDGSGAMIRKLFSGVTLLEFVDNAGFAGGVNRGIRTALDGGVEYIALLNNDAVADSAWLERLTVALDNAPAAGAVASKVLTADGKRIDSTGDFYSVWGLPFPRGRDEVEDGQYDGTSQRAVFGVSGCASMYRAAMLRQVGLFDERFFVYFEDLDLSFRGRLAGWSMIYEPRAIVFHSIGGTSSRIGHVDNPSNRLPDGCNTRSRPSAFARFHTVKNFVYVYTKNMPGILFWKYLPRMVAAWAMMFASDASRGLWWANAKGNLVAAIHLPKMLKARSRIQRTRRVSVREIDAILYKALPPLQQQRIRRMVKRQRK
jgi:GT2 family glycosyltransferase